MINELISDINRANATFMPKIKLSMSFLLYVLIVCSKRFAASARATARKDYIKKT